MAGVQGCAVRKLVKLGYRNIALTAIAAARVAACVGVHAKRCRPLHGEHAAHSAQYTNGGSAFAQSRTKKNRAIYVAQVTYRGQRPLLFCPSLGPRGIATLAIRRQAEAGPCERKTPIYAAATHVEAAW